MPSQSVRLLGTALIVVAVLGLLAWADYAAVRRELESGIRAQASAVHATVAAAARAQHAAALQAEAAMSDRLLQTARVLREMDRRGLLKTDVLDALAGPNPEFRIVVFGADGRREYVAGDAPGPGWGGGLGRGLHAGAGLGPGAGGPRRGATRIAERLLSGESDELVASPHASRDGQERIAAGVRRIRGGAIVLNAANRAAAELEQVYSLSSLLQQIADATPEIGYIVLDQADRRVAHGALGDLVPSSAPPGIGERFQQVAASRVLERTGTIPLDESREATLRIGMRLDDVKRGERRTLVRIAIVFGSIGALTIAALALVGLRQRYGELSVRHARAQDALARKDRLAAMGEMASTVAHEIRNPLNAIAMSGQRLAGEFLTAAAGADTEAVELIDVIRGETGRIEERVQQFLEFARPRALNRETVDVDAMLDDVAAAIQPFAASRDVRVEQALLSRASMRLDVDMIRQVLDNLLRNAVEATPAGGAVTLASSRRAGTIELQVRDTGAGIPADVLPRIFDLYFTTKANGTGIGLAVAQQIVTAHGGTIDVESVEGSGTVMRVRLPEHGGADA